MRIVAGWRARRALTSVFASLVAIVMRGLFGAKGGRSVIGTAAARRWFRPLPREPLAGYGQPQDEASRHRGRPRGGGLYLQRAVRERLCLRPRSRWAYRPVHSEFRQLRRADPRPNTLEDG